MDKIIKKVLNKIEKNGYEAYIVGGYVRDLLLKKTTYDIDICTNAVPKELKKIFPVGLVTKYGNISFKMKKYDIEITTYRKETGYVNRRPQKVEYISNLIEDLHRRDFTINTICMNQKGIIIDLLDGYKDLKEKNVKMVGDPFLKLKEDPLRILRAIRFATSLNFNLDSALVNAIHENRYEILLLSKNRVKTELDKILMSENFLKGIELLNKFNMLEILGISFGKIVKVYDLVGMWAQLNLKEDFPFTKEDRNNIIKIKEIVKGGEITKNTLFNYGLYLSSVAGDILKIDKIVINKLYKSLPIYSVKDLCLKSSEIKKFLNIEDGKILGNITNDLVLKILNGDLKNNKKSVYQYLDGLKADWYENKRSFRK